MRSDDDIAALVDPATLAESYARTVGARRLALLDDLVPRALAALDERKKETLSLAFALPADDPRRPTKEARTVITDVVAEAERVVRTSQPGTLWTEDERATIRSAIVRWFAAKHVEVDGALVPAALADSLRHAMDPEATHALSDVVLLGRWPGLRWYPTHAARILLASETAHEAYRQRAADATAWLLDDLERLEPSTRDRVQSLLTPAASEAPVPRSTLTALRDHVAATGERVRDAMEEAVQGVKLALRILSEPNYRVALADRDDETVPDSDTTVLEALPPHQGKLSIKPTDDGVFLQFDTPATDMADQMITVDLALKVEANPSDRTQEADYRLRTEIVVDEEGQTLWSGSVSQPLPGRLLQVFADQSHIRIPDAQ